jgi:two-component system cell cycle response regulator CpdR
MARILLAEDDESMRTFLLRALERVGHEVTAVGDGFAALPYVANTKFDLLLTDIVMPGMDGLELARRASIELPGIRVIFITGFAAVALNNNAARHPNARVLSKPFHLRSLVDEIDRVLAPSPTPASA